MKENIKKALIEIHNKLSDTIYDNEKYFDTQASYEERKAIEKLVISVAKAIATFR